MLTTWSKYPNFSARNLPYVRSVLYNGWLKMGPVPSLGACGRRASDVNLVGDMDMRTTRVLLICLVSALSFLMTGCPDGTVGQVEGTIMLDGKPIPNVRIRFKPVDTNSRTSWAETDAEGHYVIQFGRDDPGATVGQSKVTLVTRRVRRGGGAVEIFPEKFNRETELVRDVTSGSQTIDFDLKSD